MRVLFLTLLAAVPVYGTDAQKLALDIAAQADFEHVLALPAPDLASTSKCVQSQAMSLAVAAPADAPQLTFRKGYCQMADAVASQNRTALAQAAQTFDEAIAAEEAASIRQKRPQIIPYTLNAPYTWRILAAVARLNAGATIESQEQSLSRAVDADVEDGTGCQTNGASARFCHSVHQLGSAWLGWIALGHGERGGDRHSMTDQRSDGLAHGFGFDIQLPEGLWLVSGAHIRLLVRNKISILDQPVFEVVDPQSRSFTKSNRAEVACKREAMLVGSLNGGF